MSTPTINFKTCFDVTSVKNKYTYLNDREAEGLKKVLYERTLWGDMNKEGQHDLQEFLFWL
jgi:hypothetical protein